MFWLADLHVGEEILTDSDSGRTNVRTMHNHMHTPNI